jgi:Leucine-rich repeat (LRR) protein
MNMNLYKNLCLCLLIALGVGRATAQCDRKRDSTALVSFYLNTLGDSWTKKNFWLTNAPISTWYGLTLTSQGCVKSIKLPNNRLNGFITKEIEMLSELEVLNLSNNVLTGNIPPEVTKLTKLSILALDQNFFTGNIPSGIGGMTNLQELLLSQNSMAGSIPSSVGNLTKLTVLGLSQNKFFGSIPAAISNLQNLRTFYADNNKLSGTIPKGLYSLSQLTELWLYNNNFIGNIDPDLGNLSKMQKLLINNNKITGPIPTSIGTLTNMVSFNASSNNLTGSIPPEIVGCKSLISLQIAHNMLTGSIPTNIGDISNLATLDLSSNELTGEMPYSLGRPANLKRIYLDTNKIVGCFPKSISGLCTLMESQNINANGYNFRGNTDLFFDGDFGKWCKGIDVAKAVIEPVMPLCEGSTLNLNGSGGSILSWTGPAAFVSNISVPTIADIKAENFGIYKLYVEGLYTCRDTSSIQVKPIDSPTTTVNSPLCEGNTIQFTAIGGVSYTWSGPNNFSSSLDSPLVTNAGPNAAGTYTVKIKTADCEFTRTLDVNFTKLGSVTTTSPTLCEGDTIKLLAQLASGQSVSWSGPNNYKSTDSAPEINNVKSSSSGEYLATIKDPNGCQATSKVIIDVQKPKELTITDFATLCHTSDSMLLPSSVQSNTGSWSGLGVSNVSNGAYFNPASQNGAITLTFDPEAKCTADLTTTIKVNRLGIIATENAASNSDTDDNGSIKLSLETITNGINITYSGKVSGSIEGNNGTIIINNLPSGVYNIAAVDDSGCRDTASVTVRYTRAFYHLPNVINAQSLTNNSFYVKGSNVLSYDMYVYDRWGNIVFENKNQQVNDAAGGWLPDSDRILSGVYVYKIIMKTLEGDKTHQGNLTVL